MFRNIPKGYFCNDSGEPNCKIHNRSLSKAGGIVMQVPEIVALRDLNAGEEILVAYNNNDSRAQAAAASASKEKQADDEADWKAFHQLAVPKPKMRRENQGEILSAAISSMLNTRCLTPDA